MRIENLQLADTAGSRGDRGLRTWIAEGAERVGRGVNRGSRNPRAIERIEDRHRGAVGPAHRIDSAPIDFALGKILTHKMIDRGGVRIFAITGAAPSHIAGRIQLPLPVVPSKPVRIEARIVMRGVAALRR